MSEALNATDNSLLVVVQEWEEELAGENFAAHDETRPIGIDGRTLVQQFCSNPVVVDDDGGSTEEVQSIDRA